MCVHGKGGVFTIELLFCIRELNLRFDDRIDLTFFMVVEMYSLCISNVTLLVLCRNFYSIFEYGFVAVIEFGML